jgi:hypothetical protein
MSRNEVIRTVVTKRAAEFDIPDDGIACVRVFTAEGIIEIFCSPHILLASSANSMRAVVDWQSRQSDPIRFRREPEEV